MSRGGVAVRPAGTEELSAVMNVLDAAMLEVDARAVRTRIGRGDVLVAVEEARVLGACVLESDGDEGAHVEAIAVRPGRRGQGVGSALVEAASDRYGKLSAGFDGGVRPFYASLGFDVEPLGDGRFRGVRGRR